MEAGTERVRTWGMDVGGATAQAWMLEAAVAGALGAAEGSPERAR